MTAEQIKTAARSHFANRGYEGASMAQIADEVGIKKQSIYTHFKGKDQLFLQVCRDVFADESTFIKHFIDLNNRQDIKTFLFDFLLQYKERCEKEDSARFWLRVSFFPPAHLYEEVISYVYGYLDELEQLLILVIETARVDGMVDPRVDAGQSAAAFLGVLDGILVEMLYGDESRLAKRIDASWHMYWRGLSPD